VELYVPLSAQLSLGMMSAAIREGIEQELTRMPADLKLDSEGEAARQRLTEFVSQLRGGATATLQPTNVDHLNSLQVWGSARYVYSAGANFDLVREMLRDHPELKSGSRFRRVL
jgi:hypothetical protein